MTTLRRILTATALAAAAATFASASPLIGCADTGAFTVAGGTQSLCLQADALDAAVNWGPLSLSISQFNPTLGTLNYVEIIAWASGNATLKVSDNNSTTDESFTGGFAHISESFSGTGFTTITLSGGVDNQSGTVPAGTQQTIASSSFSADTTGSATVIQNSILNPNALAPFIGTGTLGALTGNGGPSSASGTGGTDLFYNASGDVGGTLAVLYDYTPPPSGIPEPATMALMGGALLGLGTMGKRFLKKS